MKIEKCCISLYFHIFSVLILTVTSWNGQSRVYIPTQLSLGHTQLVNGRTSAPSPALLPLPYPAGLELGPALGALHVGGRYRLA